MIWAFVASAFFLISAKGAYKLPSFILADHDAMPPYDIRTSSFGLLRSDNTRDAGVPDGAT
jgi:hypothetical protein